MSHHTENSPARHDGPAAALGTAIALVALITLILDPHRTILLLIPLSFLLAAHGSSRSLDHVMGSGWISNRTAPMLRLAIRLTAGLALLGWMHVLGAFSGWFREAIGLSVLIGVGAELAAHAPALRRLRLSTRAWRPSLTGAAMGLLWAVAWLWGTIPPVFYDELAYHLVIPQRALADGLLPALPWSFFTFMPCLADLMLGWGLWLGNAVGAHALHTGFWAVLTLAVWGLADEISGKIGGAWSAAAVALALAATPTVWYLGVLPFSECLLSLAMVASLGFLRVSREAPPRGWVFGLLLGMGAMAKLSGVAWAAAGLAAALVLRWPMRTWLAAAAAVAISLAPWWTRSALLAGNPIYPVGYELFGGRYWSTEQTIRLHADNPPTAGNLGLSGLLKLPLKMVTDPDQFASGSLVGLLAVGSVCLLLSLPIVTRLLHARPEERHLGDALAVWAWIAAAAWVSTAPATRYLSPALLAGLAVSTGLALRRPERTIRIGLFVILLLGAAWGTQRFLGQHEEIFSSAQAALGRESDAAYVARTLDYGEAARIVREQTPADATVLFIGETRSYYFMRRAIAPHPLDRHPLARWVAESSTPEALRDRLRAEGVTHVVLNAWEFQRLQKQYGLLSFQGPDAAAQDQRLKKLPAVLTTLYGRHGHFVLAVPAAETR